jgi:hypothetical protein
MSVSRRGRRSDRSSAPAVFDGSNPLLDEWRRSDGAADAERLASLCATFAFAIPTDSALRVIAAHSPAGVVELGAGAGYWASLLDQLGVDVVAFDRAPPLSPDNKWFHSSTPWFRVQRGDELVVAQHAARTLLLVWPTRDETWAADALTHFHGAGGDSVIYVGEGPGGRTGDATFHALLGATDGCLACRYGVLDVVCTCGVTALWRQVDSVVLPHWLGQRDDLHVYRRLPLVSPP